MRLAITLSFLLVLGACGGGAAAAVGKWSLDANAMADMMLKAQAADLAKLPAEERAKTETQMREMSKAMKADLTVNADNTFTVHMDMGPMHSEVKGTWKADGNKLTMTGKEVGKEKEDTMTGTLVGDVLTCEGGEGAEKMTMTFVRAK